MAILETSEVSPFVRAVAVSSSRTLLLVSRWSLFDNRVSLGRIVSRLQHAIGLGYALGALDGLLVSGEFGLTRRLRLMLAAGAVVAIVATAFGLVSAIAAEASRSLRTRLPSRELRLQATNASAVGGVVGWLLSVIAFAVVLKGAQPVTVAPLRDALLLLGVSVSGAVAIVSSRYLEAILDHFGNRSLLAPHTLSSNARRLLLQVLPLVVASVVLIGRFGEQLGLLRRALFVLVFLVLEAWTFRVCGRLRVEGSGFRVGGLLLAIGIGAGAASLRQASWVAQTIHLGRISPDALELIHRATDVDHDGYSSVFGGRDCAAFDEGRHPGTRELPNNGIDENCDGHDAEDMTVGTIQPRFYGHVSRSGEPLHVVWYVVDSLRADHLPIYGYGFDTTPNLRAMAADSWVFEQAYSQSSTTALSMPSMLSGLNPQRLRYREGPFPTAVADEFYIAREFSIRGYATHLLVNDWVRERLTGIQHGFREIQSSPAEVNWRSGDRVLESLTTLMRDAAIEGRSVFAVAHVDDVHHPYRAAEGSDLPAFPAPGEQAHYDRSIALFDRALGAFVEELRQMALWDRTVLIVTADHGDEFGEHGGEIHSRTCFGEVTHVPLIVRIPGEMPRRVEQRVALVDIVPTLLELMGDDLERDSLDGQSLFLPVYAPHVLDPTRPVFCTISGVMPGRGSFFTRAVRAGNWSMHEEMISGRRALYDLQRDPGEHQNLADDRQYETIRSELLRLLSNAAQGNLFRVSLGLE